MNYHTAKLYFCSVPISVFRIAHRGHGEGLEIENAERLVNVAYWENGEALDKAGLTNRLHDVAKHDVISLRIGGRPSAVVILGDPPDASQTMRTLGGSCGLLSTSFSIVPSVQSHPAPTKGE